MGMFLCFCLLSLIGLVLKDCLWLVLTGEEEDRLGVRWGKCGVDGFDISESV